MFEKYKTVYDVFKNKYSVLEVDYPYAFFYLDKILRMKISGQANLVNRDLKNLTRIKLGTVIYLLVKKFEIFTRNDKSVMFFGNRFKDLQGEICSHFLQEGYFCIKNPSFLNFLEGFSLVRYFKLLILFRKINKIGIEALLKNNKLLATLNDLARDQVNDVTRELKLNNVRYVFLEGDSLPRERVICQAAKEVGAKTIVLVHGYVQSPTLITVAPVFADRLCVWTKEQQEDLINTVDESSSGKIKYCGSFFNFRKKDTEASSYVLFALEPTYGNFNSSKEYIEVVNSYLSVLGELGVKCVIKPHPKDKCYLSFLSEVLGADVVPANMDIYDLIEKSKCIIGSNSSVLVQAQLLGVKSFQIKELSTFYFDSVEKVDLKRLTKLFSDQVEDSYFRVKDIIPFSVACAIDFYQG